MSFNVKLTATQQCQVTVSGAVDKKGNPASLDGPPVFASADTSVCTFETDPSDASGMTGLIVAVGPLATAAAVTITGDADLGAGVQAIVENGFVEITAGQAVGFSTTVGTPTEQP
jgi:hypothetical protein